MPHRIVITRTAESNLESIGDYIAQDNPGKARETILKIRTRIEDLAHLPMRNRVREDLGRDRRILVIDNYLVVYRLENDSVIIQRVSEGSRDMKRLLDEDDSPGL